MKLKPLVKTHWLASQNPMNVSLAGLKRVVFCPPPSVLNSEFAVDSERQIVLPPVSELRTLKPDEEEIRELMTRRHTLARDIFWILFSGHDLQALRTPPASLKALAQSMEFHFEDGQIFSLIGIFRKANFPLFLDPHFYLQDKSANWSRALEGKAEDYMKSLKILDYQKKNEDFQKSWFVLLEIMAWAMQRQRQVGDLELLWTEAMPEPDMPRIGYHLTDIEFLKSRPLTATVMSEPEVRNTARMTIWQGIDNHKPPGILRFHSMGSLGDLESQGNNKDIEPKAQELETLKSLDQPFEWKPLMLMHESGAKAVAKALGRLEASLGPANIHFVGHTVVTGKDFRPFLQLRESDSNLEVALRFKIDSMGLQHLNFPHSLARAFAPFWGGMDHFFSVDRKEVASHLSQYRAADLLILRHQGLAVFCLLELINWKLKRPLSSGLQIDFVDDQSSPEADRQFDLIVKYFKTAIPGLLGKSGVGFDELFSSKVKTMFVDFIEKLFEIIENDRSLMFQGSQVGELKDVQSQVLLIMRFLILHFIEASQGKLLTRAQSPIDEKFKETIVAWTEPRLIPLDLTPAGETATPQFEPLWVDVGPYSKYVVSLLFELHDEGVEVEFNGQPFVADGNPFEFIFSVNDAEQKEDSNWFDLHPQIFFNGERISSEEVQFNFTPDQVGFIEYRGQMYRIDKKQIPSLKSLQRFWNRIRKDKTLVKRNAFGEKVYRLEKSQALELLMLKSQGIEVRVTGEWKRIFDYFENGLGVDKIELPESMTKALLPHQQEGAQWLHDLYELRLGAILADEMGLGKTFQVLAFLASLQTRQELKKTLVVVPTSLVYNWIDEKQKFAPDLPTRVFVSAEMAEVAELLKTDEPIVLIATYGLLHENIAFFENYHFNVVAFDEAQNLKNITSLRSVSARRLRSNFKVCMTGTPMENNYLEFYSLCDLVVPGCLGDVDSFRKKYYNLEVRPESLRELRMISKPLLLRRTKSQVKLSLPVKTLNRVVLPFSGKQKEIYKRMAMTFSRQVEELIQDQGERKAQIAMFAALMRLRQICSDPAAVPGVVFEERPVKVEHFLSSLTEHLAEGESVIVFTQFLSTLGRIEGELLKAKVPTFTLQGRVSAKERLRLISAFQASPEPGVMLMTLKTGGVGLNLTKASVVYHLEPWWNPAVENQATDRAHRMGQTKDVKVYNLLIEGSLEERIADLKLKKQGSFDRLFGDAEQIDDAASDISNTLTRDDFIYLLK